MSPGYPGFTFSETFWRRIKNSSGSVSVDSVSAGLIHQQAKQMPEFASVSIRNETGDICIRCPEAILSHKSGRKNCLKNDSQSVPSQRDFSIIGRPHAAKGDTPELICNAGFDVTPGSKKFFAE